MTLIRVVTALLALIAARVVLAQDATSKRRYEVKHASNPPAVDGRLDDACWASSEWSRRFVQKEPYEGAPPTEETAFQITFDDRNIYVAIRAYDSEPSYIEKRLVRRDDRQGDQVEILFDSYFDHRTAFGFNVNGAGVKTDYVLSDDGANEDISWDAVWHARVESDDEGWTAELAIPFSQLRFANVDSPLWGLQVRRRLHREEEVSAWQFVPKETASVVSRFGILEGLEGISATRLIELVPYAVVKAERFEREEGNPFATGRRDRLTGGLDGRLAVTSDLMLSFTVNPDFGQVEADPSEVNLTTFETFFEEKRPFFIEGKNIFDFDLAGFGSRETLFYSRRIGRMPQRTIEIDDGEFIDAPANASILGAFKLTGKTSGGWSVGILDSITTAEYADIDTDGARRREAVEPFANYFVGRAQKDFAKGRTVLGTMLTATSRSAEDADLANLHRDAYTGGLDLFHTWSERKYFLRAKGVFSQVAGTAETIEVTQRSSLRYFQRPDADYLEVDESRTSLGGHGGDVELGKSGGGHLRFAAGASWRSPGLELNDVGFLRTADRITQWSNVGWRIWQPFSIFRSLNVNVNQFRGWDFGGTNLFGNVGVGANTQFRNYWRLASGFFREQDQIQNNALRGGPSLRYPGGVGHWFNARSDERRKFRFNVGAFNFWGGEARIRNFWLGSTYLPGHAASISVEPFVNFINRDAHYVSTVELDSLESRYVMGRLDQTTVGITLRLNYSVTPDLSIQFYGQPFLSSGSYDSFKRITEPRASGYEDRFACFPSDNVAYLAEQNVYRFIDPVDGANYSISNPDFDFWQFRSNLVVRWEYQPGATLFIVWSQDRTRDGDRGDFSFRDGLHEIFRTDPYNVFLVKFSYRFAS